MFVARCRAAQEPCSLGDSAPLLLGGQFQGVALREPVWATGANLSLLQASPTPGCPGSCEAVAERGQPRACPGCSVSQTQARSGAPLLRGVVTLMCPLGKHPPGTLCHSCQVPKPIC